MLPRLACALAQVYDGILDLTVPEGQRLMNAHDRTLPKATFQWDDPLLLDGQLTEDERMICDTAREFAAQAKLAAPCAKGLPRDEKTEP